MRRPLAFALPSVLAAGLAACGGPAEPPGPPRLAYEVPTQPYAVYVQGDTAEVAVDAGGQMVDVTVASSATWEMSFELTADGAVQVTTRVTDFDASATNPMGPTQRIDEGAIDGDLVFNLSPTGVGTLVTAPDLSEEARNFVSPNAIAATFFPRLPARAVTAGDTWTDTVRIDAEEGESSIESTSVVSYTAVGDTTVMGANYLLVRFTSEDERYIEGTQMGMDMSQEIVGSSEGWFLWDPARKLPTEILVNSEGDGTMEVSAAPFPLSLQADNVTHIRLQPAEGGGM
ncbi:MAG: hypothetical protein PVI57_09260 [Gemmatimonadota bacterium]|jgi:hypothetical protein